MGAEKNNNEDHAQTVAFFVELVLPAIVEDDAATLLPGVNLVFDSHGWRIVLRHDQSQVIAKIAEVWTAVRGDRFARIEDGEECLIEVGNLFKESSGARAFFLI